MCPDATPKKPIHVVVDQVECKLLLGFYIQARKYEITTLTDYSKPGSFINSLC